MSKRNLTIFNEAYTDVAGFKVKDTNNSTLTYVAESDMGTDVWVDDNGYLHLSDGEGSFDDKSVFFYDYDGELIYSYSAAETQLMTELPPNPSHTGLTAQGWNWTLAEIKSQLTNVGGDVVVGQNYVTDDGKTRIYITIEDDAVAAEPFYIAAITPTVATGVTINWGDGNSETTTTTGSGQLYPHTYASAGDYVITIEATSGTYRFAGWNTGDQVRIYGKEKNEMWYNRARVRKIELGSDCTEIYQYCFNGCINCETISMPTTVAMNAALGCRKLKGFVVPHGATNSGEYQGCVLLNTVSLPYTVISINGQAFYGCYSLEHITIPGNVTTINRLAFSACYNLKRIVLPQNDSLIIGADNIIANTRMLTEIKFPNVGVLGASILSGASNLKKVTLPNNLRYLPSGCFNECPNLQNVIIPDTVKLIRDNVFYNAKKIDNINISDDVTCIDNNAFWGSNSTFNFPQKLVYLGTSACCQTFLTEADVPNGITMIKNNLFDSSYRLSKIIIPSGVISIAKEAFRRCYSLKELHMHPSTPPTLDNINAFTDVPLSELTIYVPKGSLSAYQGATNWSTYASYMQEDNISSVSCTYTQSGTVYNTDDIDILRDDLVVTVNYDDNTSETITNYLLTGKLFVGTSTITVTYGGKTTTFTITVTANPNLIHSWDFTSGLTDSIGSVVASLSSSGVTQDSSGLSITSTSGYCYLGSISQKNDIIIQMDISSMDRKNTGNGKLIVRRGSSGDTNSGNALYIDSTNSCWRTNWGSTSGLSSVQPNDLNGKTITLVYNYTNDITKLYVDNNLKIYDIPNFNTTNPYGWQIGSSNYSLYNITITGLRIYSL